MPKRYTIAEARRILAAIVHELERQLPFELTRRGQPVTILVSLKEYQRLAAPQVGFWEAYEPFRQQVNLPQLNITPDVFENVRDQSAGHEVHP